jgi:hypothetical protein
MELAIKFTDEHIEKLADLVAVRVAELIPKSEKCQCTNDSKCDPVAKVENSKSSKPAVPGKLSKQPALTVDQMKTAAAKTAQKIQNAQKVKDVIAKFSNPPGGKLSEVLPTDFPDLLVALDALTDGC